MVRASAYVAVITITGGAAALYRQAPEIAAGALLHPVRTQMMASRPVNCIDREYLGANVKLRGWQCAAGGTRLGTIVYLHGIADNRASAVGPIRRFTAAGFDVVAYDARAHGQSEGDACTYGFYEKQDLQRVIDTLPVGPIVLIGTSLGAAVALQAAAEDPRISGIVAAEVFRDLETIATERAPTFMWPRLIRQAFDVAEARGHFDIQAVSPLEAARRIHVPVLLLHGERDTDTPDAHSVLVHTALAGPKRLVLLAGIRHNESLGSPEAWQEIDRWIAAIVRGV